MLLMPLVKIAQCTQWGMYSGDRDRLLTAFGVAG